MCIAVARRIVEQICAIGKWGNGYDRLGSPDSQIALASLTYQLILPFDEMVVTLTSVPMTRNFLSTRVLIRYAFPLSCKR